MKGTVREELRTASRVDPKLNNESKLSNYQNNWLQHVHLMDSSRILKFVLQYHPQALRYIGKPTFSTERSNFSVNLIMICQFLTILKRWVKTTLLLKNN